VPIPKYGGDENSPEPGKNELDRIVKAVGEIAGSTDLRRLDCHQDMLNVTLLLELPDADAPGKILSSVRKGLPEASISIVDKESLG
jgi:hypothetical protein